MRDSSINLLMIFGGAVAGVISKVFLNDEDFSPQFNFLANAVMGSAATISTKVIAFDIARSIGLLTRDNN